MKVFKEILPYLIILIVVVLIRSFLFTPAIVNGDSMKETLLNNEVVIVDKINLKRKGIKRYDIVVIKHDGETLVKRIIGLPGESVEYKDNALYINGKKETKYKFQKTKDFKYDEVEKDSYFVLGDNRSISLDSRYFGTIKKKEIKGKVKYIIFPFSRIGVVK